jgi:hypothetical protein
MTRTCCTSCRLRFPCSKAADLLACPFCGGPLEERGAEGAIGFRLLGREERPGTGGLHALAVAVNAAAEREPRA